MILDPGPALIFDKQVSVIASGSFYQLHLLQFLPLLHITGGEVNVKLRLPCVVAVATLIPLPPATVLWHGWEWEASSKAYIAVK